MKRILAIVPLLTSAVATAQEATRPFAAPTTLTSPAPSGIESLGQVTIALGLVLAVIFVAAWLLRRMRGFGKTGTGARHRCGPPLARRARRADSRGHHARAHRRGPGRVTRFTF
jgi:hypothetical protein